MRKIKWHGDEFQVKTERYRPPIPSDIYWTAWLDGLEEMGSGFGSTEEEAVSDVIELAELRGWEPEEDE